MNGEISGLIANVRIISDEVLTVFGDLSAEQLNWKPGENEWSIGQCFDHLIKTDSLYFPNVQKVADGTHENNWFSVIPFLTGFVGKMLKKAVSPDSLKKMKAPGIFVPSSSEISETIIEDFGKNQEKLISLMEAVKNLDIQKIKIPTPISPAANIYLNDAFEAILMHERRHFNQAKRVMENEGFPK